METKTKKPFYKRWWFITLVAILILGGIISDDEEEISSDEEEVTAEEINNDAENNEKQKPLNQKEATVAVLEDDIINYEENDTVTIEVDMSYLFQYERTKEKLEENLVEIISSYQQLEDILETKFIIMNEAEHILTYSFSPSTMNELDTGTIEATSLSNDADEYWSLQEETAALEKENKVLEFEGETKVEVDEDEIVVIITSNVPDGGIFEVAILDNAFNVESSFIPIEKGVIEERFSTDNFNVGYLSTLVQFRFNLEDEPQPEHILDRYGEAGENMSGSQAHENNLDGYNGIIENVSFAYPDEETVAEKAAEILNDSINELIEVTEGIILDVEIIGDNGDLAYVIVSDDWYYSPDHEKERFAEQVGETVETIVLNAYPDAHTVGVHFKDEYGSDLASPKMFGGYNIKD
ncbi:hypothetical protein [Alkalicoccus daliensis]|uniref:Uncharacterized protein n=1 Tax=Alkalicoccus daliensis TaxID=745820 RepID=A0A1H0F7Y7_9BACI|nr:hypothetical protein [Alkalicoccus daliensis]SDN90672.1 hypothetical protein SAMN04488053_104224 [Alkalicoccus daliensis]